ncbi:MAG: flagellar motor switch protein FliN [Armatimonadota bacterium]
MADSRNDRDEIDADQPNAASDQLDGEQSQTISMEQAPIAEQAAGSSYDGIDRPNAAADSGQVPCAGPRPMELLMDVQLDLSVELGRASVAVKELLQLGPGTVLELDRLAEEPVDILANGKLIARGEIVVVDDCFGVKILQIVTGNDSAAQAA